ncbi:acyl-CoA dehydrogenase family protein [Streptomyces hyaluromycini]|uniref:Acyl-CoA dehydrogenase family protein n=1 Tax=Streptomyces hyaluromycini TaxID=1377993 RepID=A0ABV1X7S7_9ACTN
MHRQAQRLAHRIRSDRHVLQTGQQRVAVVPVRPGRRFDRALLRQAAYLLGIAAGAHRAALEYTGFRRQSGARLRDLPAVSFPLARALVALRATRAAVYRGAWLVDSEPHAVGTAPVMALALAAETARDVVRLSMQSCGVRAMTAEPGLHRYFRLAAAESARYGDPAALWRTVGADRIRSARRAAAGTELPVAASTLPQRINWRADPRSTAPSRRRGTGRPSG